VGSASAAVQRRASSGHSLVVLFFFDSTEHTLDVVTQDCMLKVLGLLLMYILKNFQKAHTGLVLGFWIRAWVYNLLLLPATLLLFI